MRPFEFMSSHSLAPESSRRAPAVPTDEAIAQFLTLSAHYMNLPAEWLAKLKQQK